MKGTRHFREEYQSKLTKMVTADDDKTNINRHEHNQSTAYAVMIALESRIGYRVAVRHKFVKSLPVIEVTSNLG